MNRTLTLFSTIFIITALTAGPSTARAQTPAGRVAAESAGGVGGAIGLGGAGILVGTAGMLCLSDHLSPAAPIAGGITGAAAGTLLGVFGAGSALGGQGTLSDTGIGLMAGSAVTAIAWGVLAAAAKPGSKPGWLGHVVLITTAALPVAGAVAGFESR